MIYYSQLTPKGNSSWSGVSQEQADANAKFLDDNDCTGCTGCMGCTDCTDCTGCTDCMDCTRCTRCTDCTGCTDCMDCTRCTGEVIQAGCPNDWFCYGHLVDERLMIHCGCRRFRLDEALAYWDHPEKPNRREVVAAVRYIAEVARLRSWEV